MLRLELPSYDLRSFEGFDRMLDSLSQLQETSNKAFSHIASRMNAINSRISQVNTKTSDLQQKIDLLEKSETQYNLKFVSLSRYPTSKKAKIGKNITTDGISEGLPTRINGYFSNNIPASEDSKGKAPEIKYDEAPEIVNQNFTKINQFHSNYEGEFNVMSVES